MAHRKAGSSMPGGGRLRSLNLSRTSSRGAGPCGNAGLYAFRGPDGTMMNEWEPVSA